MLNILIAPDSFKGTLSAVEVTQAIAQGLRRARPQVDLQCMPLADGGEGTLDVVLDVCAGARRQVEVTQANGQRAVADYGVIRQDDTDIAILESAKAVGWGGASGDVMQRTTYGLGEMIRHCLDHNLRHFWIGLGGSCTNDGGLGLLQALGLRVFDAQGQDVAPTPSGLLTLHRINWDHLDSRLHDCQIVLLADVDNPLTGVLGATAVFGPQKGVTAANIAKLDQALVHYAALGDTWAGKPLSAQPGAGAAGGLGYALMLCGAVRQTGAEMICELLRLDETLKHCDLVITGEGRSDAQTLHGKLPWVVARHAQQYGVKAVLLSGSIDPVSRDRLQEVFAQCISLEDEEVSLQEAMQEPARHLAQRAYELMKIWT